MLIFCTLLEKYLPTYLKEKIFLLLFYKLCLLPDFMLLNQTTVQDTCAAMEHTQILPFLLFCPSFLPAFLFAFSIFSFHSVFFTLCNFCLAASPCLHPVLLFLSFLFSSLVSFLSFLLISFPLSSSKTNKLPAKVLHSIVHFFGCLTLQEPLRNN